VVYGPDSTSQGVSHGSPARPRRLGGPPPPGLTVGAGGGACPGQAVRRCQAGAGRPQGDGRGAAPGRRRPGRGGADQGGGREGQEGAARRGPGRAADGPVGLGVPGHGLRRAQARVPGAGRVPAGARGAARPLRPGAGRGRQRAVPLPALAPLPGPARHAGRCQHAAAARADPERLGAGPGPYPGRPARRLPARLQRRRHPQQRRQRHLPRLPGQQPAGHPGEAGLGRGGDAVRPALLRADALLLGPGHPGQPGHRPGRRPGRHRRSDAVRHPAALHAGGPDHPDPHPRLQRRGRDPRQPVLRDGRGPVHRRGPGRRRPHLRHQDRPAAHRASTTVSTTSTRRSATSSRAG
jgi:hypothetical protein